MGEGMEMGIRKNRRRKFRVPVSHKYIPPDVIGKLRRASHSQNRENRIRPSDHQAVLIISSLTSYLSSPSQFHYFKKLYSFQIFVFMKVSITEPWIPWSQGMCFKYLLFPDPRILLDTQLCYKDCVGCARMIAWMIGKDHMRNINVNEKYIGF